MPARPRNTFSSPAAVSFRGICRYKHEKAPDEIIGSRLLAPAEYPQASLED